MVALLSRRRPDPGKVVLQHQIQNVRCIAAVRLLLPYLCSTDSRRIPDPDLVPHLTEHVGKPMAVPGRLQPQTHRTLQSFVEPPGFAIGMHQLELSGFACVGIHKSNYLPAGMEITTYNHHGRLLSPQLLCLQTKNTAEDGAFVFIQSTLRCLCEEWDATLSTPRPVFHSTSIHHVPS